MNEALANATDKLVVAAEQIVAQLVAVAPDALQLVLQVVRFQSIGSLALGVVLLVLVAAALRAMVWLWRASMREEREGDEAVAAALGLGSVVLLTGCIVGTIIGLIELLNIWNWVGAFWPEIRIAHNILQKVLGS